VEEWSYFDLGLLSNQGMSKQTFVETGLYTFIDFVDQTVKYVTLDDICLIIPKPFRLG
jgi:hypothetical protein